MSSKEFKEFWISNDDCGMEIYTTKQSFKQIHVIEYAAVESLRAKLASLEAKLADKCDDIERWADSKWEDIYIKKFDKRIENRDKLIDELRNQNQKLKAALEKYADMDNWSESGAQVCPSILIGEDIEARTMERDSKFTGGRLARQVLAEVEK